MTLGIVLDAEEDPKWPIIGEKFACSGMTEIVTCQTCSHGGHATYSMEWFWAADERRNHGGGL
ncbi:hypothetical protein M378DRAFT_160985 [Amanita muscaria Koide BX008]|uniref:Uncharacterized protein n=1 Tax=Amanita muscaria (strain Koide BX008) TaxID=946122 RepID=A0A0C2THW1_AMAMK|nr:hypothetical protein M378DRAFT_160985 [Amanita muscaria Koide BX008]